MCPKSHGSAPFRAHVDIRFFNVHRRYLQNTFTLCIATPDGSYVLCLWCVLVSVPSLWTALPRLQLCRLPHHLDQWKDNNSSNCSNVLHAPPVLGACCHTQYVDSQHPLSLGPYKYCVTFEAMQAAQWLSG